MEIRYNPKEQMEINNYLIALALLIQPLKHPHSEDAEPFLCAISPTPLRMSKVLGAGIWVLPSLAKLRPGV